MTKKNPSTILGGSSLKDKLYLARQELDNLQNDVIDDKQPTAPSEAVIKDSPKFHLTGRCDRKNHKYSNKAFYILDDLEKEIKRYCNGGDVAIFNYLMHLGLQEIIKRDGHSFDEVSIMEDSYIVS